MPAIQSCCRRPVLGVKTSYSLDPPRPGREQFRMPALHRYNEGAGCAGKKMRHPSWPRVDWGAHIRLVSYGERSKKFPRALAHPRQRAAFTPTGLTPQKRALTSP